MKMKVGQVVTLKEGAHYMDGYTHHQYNSLDFPVDNVFKVYEVCLPISYGRVLFKASDGQIYLSHHLQIV
jgi:hypothetical protein